MISRRRRRRSSANDDGSLASYLTMAAHMLAVNRSSSNVLWPQGVRLLVHWSAVGEKEAETDRQTDRLILLILGDRMKEKERRETDKTDRQRMRNRQTEKQREIQMIYRHTERQTGREIHRDRQNHRGTKRQRQRQGERHWHFSGNSMK